MTTDELIDFFGAPISVYTRDEALADGVLVDATAWARECGFRVPVALTAALWALLAEGESGADSARGRARDVLAVAAETVRAMIRRNEEAGPFRVWLDGHEHDLWLAFNPYEGFTIGLPRDF